MKTTIISSDRGTYLRVNKQTARKVFEEGTGRLYVMSSDRNPVNSLTTAHEYKQGCKPYTYNPANSIETFDEVLEDFSTWLDTDGYGHMPDTYRANKYLFSYWVKIEN